jgi:CHAD domain-containing protein
MESGSPRTKALFQKLSRNIRKLPSTSDPEVVHQLRTTIRRIETLLKHRLPATGKPAKVLAQLKRVRRRAGEVRDLHVQVDALKTLSHQSIARERTVVMRALTKAETQRMKKLLKVLDGELDDGLNKRLRNVNDTLAAQESVPTDGKDYVGDALTRFAALAQGHGELTEANLHQFRMDCKRLRYLAEMAVDDRRAEAVVRHLKRVQDAIGEWHDWLNLEQTAVQALSEPGSSLVARVRAQKQRKFSDALRTVTKVEDALLHLPGQPGKKPAASSTPPAAARVAVAG